MSIYDCNFQWKDFRMLNEQLIYIRSRLQEMEYLGTERLCKDATEACHRAGNWIQFISISGLDHLAWWACCLDHLLSQGFGPLGPQSGRIRKQGWVLPPPLPLPPQKSDGGKFNSEVLIWSYFEEWVDLQRQRGGKNLFFSLGIGHIWYLCPQTGLGCARAVPG